WTRAGTGPVIVDFRGRRLNSITVNGADLPLTTSNRAHVIIPESAVRSGENEATFAFVTDVSASGASIIRTHDPDGSDYLYTLLVPADANQLFPCFDQPDLKARVTFTLTAPRAWKTLANGAENRADTSGTALTHHFNATKPLSTYLIAFAAGPWTTKSST